MGRGERTFLHFLPSTNFFGCRKQPCKALPGQVKFSQLSRGPRGASTGCDGGGAGVHISIGTGNHQARHRMWRYIVLFCILSNAGGTDNHVCILRNSTTAKRVGRFAADAIQTLYNFIGHFSERYGKNTLLSRQCLYFASKFSNSVPLLLPVHTGYAHGGIIGLSDVEVKNGKSD